MRRVMTQRVGPFLAVDCPNCRFTPQHQGQINRDDPDPNRHFSAYLACGCGRQTAEYWASSFQGALAKAIQEWNAGPTPTTIKT